MVFAGAKRKIHFVVEVGGCEAFERNSEGKQGALNAAREFSSVGRMKMSESSAKMFRSSCFLTWSTR